MNQPNVLLLLTDQQRYDVTVPGEPAVSTPNIDRLRHEGVSCTRTYTPVSICTSARASLLSGLYPHNHGMLNNCHERDAVRANLPSEIETFGELLADAGYDNTYLGKWHVGRDQKPEDFGFRFLGGQDGHDQAVDPGFREHQRAHGVDPDDVEFSETIYTDYAEDPVLIAAKTPVPKEATLTYYLAERTIDRLEEWADGEGPFFHRTDIPGPHFPYLVPEPYASMYDPDEIDLWDSFVETYDGKPEVQERYLAYRGVEGLGEPEWREALAKYFGFVTFIDEQIGRILDAVDRLGIDVAVFHTSDHGDFAGGHRQFNKGPMMYEDTYRIPLIVRWPGVVESGAERDEFVRLLDLMPTFLDMAGIEPPEGIDGRSLLSLLRGERPADWPDSVFTEYHGDEFGLYSQRMVRTGRYKYVYNPPGRDELYDLERDPDELQNLIEHPTYAEVLDELRQRLYRWMCETDDTIAGWSGEVLCDDPRDVIQEEPQAEAVMLDGSGAGNDDDS